MSEIFIDMYDTQTNPVYFIKHYIYTFFIETNNISFLLYVLKKK